MSGMDTYGIIGFAPDNVGIDKRIFINSSGYSANSTFNVSYNAGRVDVYLNGIKLVGKHNSSQSYWDFTYTTEGQGNSITLATGTALTSSDVLEVIGFVSNSGNTVTTYNFTLSGSQQAFTANHVASDLVNVFLNGVRLDAADFTLNGSDTVTLGSTAVNGDVVHIQVIGALDNANFVPVGGGTFTGDVTVPNLIISNGGNIGSASDTDAISIASDGNISLGAGIVSGNLGTITQRSASSSGITFTRSSGTIDSTILSNLYGTTNVKPNESNSTTHAWLRFSYTTAVKVTKLQWLQVDGGGAGSTENNHLSFEGSNVASPDAGAGHSDWTILSSFSTPYTNGDVLNYSGANNAIKYKHYRIRWGWASGGNYCNIHSFVLEDTDSTFDIKAPLNATGSAPIYACRAFGRTGTGSAHSNFIGKNLNYSKSSSEHTFTFTTPPSNDDYTVVSSAGRYGGYGWQVTLTSKSSSAFTLKMCNLIGTLISEDNEGVDVAVYF